MKRTFILTLTSLSLLLLGHSIYAQKVTKLNETELMLAKMQGKIYGWMTEWQVPGCAISIVKDGQV